MRRSPALWCWIRNSCCSMNRLPESIPIAVIDIQKIIEQLKGKGIGVIITDHNVRETLSICDHAYIIKDGEIIRKGRPRRLRLMTAGSSRSTSARISASIGGIRWRGMISSGTNDMGC